MARNNTLGRLNRAIGPQAIKYNNSSSNIIIIIIIIIIIHHILSAKRR
jgi:hypothetical protein